MNARTVALAAALWALAAPAAAETITSARYDEPTDRYPHAVLGDALEWGALVATLPDGSELRFRLPDASVFEDIAPRLADIDGDGEMEAWVIRANATDGASLEAYEVQNGALARKYAGPAIGRGFRWLNPVGVADFDGDGQNEAAYIETPHIGGILTFLELWNGALEISARGQTYSTHKIGSKRLDLAAVADIDGDGAADIVLPNQVHDRLLVASLIGGKVIERWRSERLPATIAGGVRLSRDGEMWTARYDSAGGARKKVVIPTLDK